jgi:membrane-associated protein
MKRAIELFLSVPAPWALGTVFALTTAEAALFFGFVIPGEIAVVLGGVLASFDRVALWQALAAAIGGALIGDSIGFHVGRHFGGRWLEKRFPRKWGAVARWIARHGPMAVFLGRYSAFLRAAVPTAAGAARMRYRAFLFWNVVGGVTWATAFTLLGYLAGEGYEAALRWAHRGSLAALIVFVAVFLVWSGIRALRRRAHIPETVEQEELDEEAAQQDAETGRGGEA